MKKILLFLFTFSFIVTWNILSQTDTIWPRIESRPLGNIRCTSKKGIQDVHVTIDRAIFNKKDHPNFNETDISMTATDSKGLILYKKNYPFLQNEELDISVDSLFLSGIGYVMLVESRGYPSSGSCDANVQIIGFNSLGYMVPYTGTIDCSDEISGNIKWVKSKTDLTSGVPASPTNCKQCDPYLEIFHFYGFCGGFRAIGYVPIEKEGIFEEINNNEAETDKILLHVGNNNYFTINEDNENAINLYSKPETISQVKIMHLTKGMTIKFFEGLHSNDIWVHLRIAGYEGYILLDDIWKLGFQPCD